MKFIDVSSDFPICSAVVYKGKIFEAVVTGIPDGSNPFFAMRKKWCAQQDLNLQPSDP